MGTCNIFKVTENRQILLNEKHTHSKGKNLRTFRLEGSSPDLMHHSDMDLVDNKSFCVRSSLCQQSSSCIILHIGCLKATIPNTPQTNWEVSVLWFSFRLTFQWGPCSLRPANKNGEFFHQLMRAGAILDGFGVFCFATGHTKITCSDGRLPCDMSGGLCLNLCCFNRGIVLFLRYWS